MIRGLPRPITTAPPRAARDFSGLWFVAPYFLLFAAFGVFGLVFSFVLSFHNWDPVAGTGELSFRGLKLYELVLTDPEFWAALGRTLMDGLPVVLAQHLIALPLAFSLHLLFRRAIGRLGVVYFLPYIASPVAFSAAAGLLYSLLSLPVSDLFGFLRDTLNADFLPRHLETASAMDGFQRVWSSVGWNLLLYLMAISAVSRSLLEAAQLDGAGFWRQLRFVVVPIVRPMIFVATSMSLVQGLQANLWRADYSDFSTVRLPGYIYGTAFKYTNFGLASTMTWVFFGVMLLLIGAAYWAFGRNFTAIETPANLESDGSPVLFAPVTTVVIKLLVTLAAVFSVYPVVLLLLQGTQTGAGDSYRLTLGGDTASNYGVLLDQVPAFWRNLWNSLYISGLASLGAMTTSALAGFAFASLKFRFKRPLFALVMGALVFPAMSNAIPYLTEMRLLNWIDQPRALWVPAAVSAIGVFLVRQFTLNSVPRTVLEAARVDGASDFVIFTRIALPQMMPVLWTVGLLTFITTWNHLEVALFLMRSETTRLLPQALAFIGDGGGDAAVLGAAIATVPPLLIYAVAAGQLGRGLGIAGEQPSGWWRWLAFWKRPDRTAVPHLTAVLNGADGIRAVACLMVVFSHLAQRLELPKQAPWIQEIQSYLMTGAFGVSAFFVLSGMLLSMPFWRRYLDGADAPNLKRYAARRFLRIAPGFYASLVIVFLLARVLEPGDSAWIRLLSGLSFTTAFHWVTFFPVELNGPLWSIGFEVVCYALMPALMIGLFALARVNLARGNRAGLVRVRQIRTVTRHATRTTARGTTETTTTIRSVTTRNHKIDTARADQPGSPALAFAYWGAAFLLTVLAHGWIVTHLVPDSDGRGWDHGLIGGAKFWMPNYNPVGLFAQYAIGVITAGLIAYRQRLLKLGRTTLPARHRRFDLTLTLAGIAAVLVLWNLRHADEFGFSLGRQPYAFPFFAILVALILYAAPFSVTAYKLLDNPFTRYTARISFGLYIWHYPILELVRLLHNPDYKYFGIASLPEWFAISAFVLGMAYWIASLSYRHIEAPFLRETGRARPKPARGVPSVASTLE